MNRCCANVAVFCLTLGGLTLATAQVSYTEASSGLQTPVMEAGNTELEFGDLNGDGHVDIAMIGDHGSPYVNSAEHGITVWFGNGAGVWSVYQNGNFGYGGIALGDVNADGLMDVGYGMHHNYSGNDFGDQLLEVALGDGTGQNWTPWDNGLATAGETWGMFGTDFADIDNDGDLDLGSISFGCCAGLHVYRNNGDGTWTHTWGYTGGNSNMMFVFGEINGDGHIDFAASHGTGTVWLGDGAGGFTNASGNLPASSYGLEGIALGDVTGDGRDDLAFVTSGGALNVWTLTGPGIWQNLSGNLSTFGSFDLAQIADMDLDGHGDVLGFAEGEPGVIKVIGGDGAGNWQQLATITPPNNCDYAAFRAGTDADHNGYPDMVIVAEENCSIWTGGTNRPRFYREASTPTSTWVHPQYPRGGETFIAGSVQFVDWSAAVAGSLQPAVDIELCLIGRDGPWVSIASSVPNNGRYQWHLSPTLLTSSMCHLRYTLGGATGVAPGAFTIRGARALADYDEDGDIDAADFGEFAGCMDGPDVGLAGAPCAVFDFDLQDDVDLVDFAGLQRIFTGSS